MSFYRKKFIKIFMFFGIIELLLQLLDWINLKCFIYRPVYSGQGGKDAHYLIDHFHPFFKILLTSIGVLDTLVMLPALLIMGFCGIYGNGILFRFITVLIWSFLVFLFRCLGRRDQNSADKI